MMEVRTIGSTGGSDRQRMEHVPSLPADLKQIVKPNLQVDTKNGLHRFPGRMELNETGLCEDDVFMNGEDHQRLEFSQKDSSEEQNTSELAQDVELLYELIEEKDAETKKLRKELNLVHTDYEELQTALAESRMIISEQQEQLAMFRQEVAVSKTNIENIKLKNIVLASNTQGHSEEMKNFLAEHGEMQAELENLRQEQKTARDQIERLTRERNFLRQKVNEGGLVVIEGGYGEDSEAGGNHPPVRPSRIKERSSLSSSDWSPKFHSPTEQVTMDAKSDAGTLIQQLREENAHWKEYANKLVRNMVELNPEVMEAIQHGEDAEIPQTESEKRWYAYAMRLLSDAVANNAAKVTEFDRKLLKSMRRKKDWKETVGAGIQSPEVSTRVNFCQTRRRKIDRLREFFKKKRP